MTYREFALEKARLELAKIPRKVNATYGTIECWAAVEALRSAVGLLTDLIGDRPVADAAEVELKAENEQLKRQLELMRKSRDEAVQRLEHIRHSALDE